MSINYINTTCPTGHHYNGFGFKGTGELARPHERFLHEYKYKS